MTRCRACRWGYTIRHHLCHMCAYWREEPADA